MQDCKLVMEISGGTLGLKGENVSLEEIAGMSVYLQATIGEQLLDMGKSLDDVKDAMWDLYIEAMEILEEQLRNRKGDVRRWHQRNGNA